MFYIHTHQSLVAKSVLISLIAAVFLFSFCIRCKKAIKTIRSPGRKVNAHEIDVK
jgi:hypothetical protein